MKGLLLYNINAGKGHIARRVEGLIAIFREAGIELRSKLINFNVNPFEGDEDAEIAVICGGDGTINYVVNSMRALGLNPVLGIIPAGTANDFANSLGMPRNIFKAARQIANGRDTKVDCGVVNGYRFVNVLSFGVLTTTSQRTSDKEKHLVGKLAYLRVGSRDLRTMHRIPLIIRINGEEFSTDAVMFLALNGKSAGHFPLAPSAMVDDGMLDVLIMEYGKPVRTCWNMMRYLLGNKPSAVRYMRSNRIEILSDICERTDVDGQRGPDFPMLVECEHNALTVRR